MAKADMETVGLCFNMPVRVAASATRGYVGEPTLVIPSYTSGVSDVNTIVVCTDDKPVIGTDQYMGLLHEDMDVNSAGTVVAHRNTVEKPIAGGTRTRGKVTTSSTADTESEAIGLLFDIYVFDLISSTYTWKPAAADTGGFIAAWYDAVKAKLDCIADARVLTRVDIS
jgi:hypothetical protein